MNTSHGKQLQQGSYPVCARQRLTIDTQVTERRVSRQTLLPFAGPRLWNSFHEVSLQLADASMMLYQVLIRLIKVLFRAKGGRDCVDGMGRRVGKVNI